MSQAQLQRVETEQSAQRALTPIYTMSDAFLQLTDLCKTFGYEHFLLGNTPEEGCDFDPSDLLLNNLPLHVVEDLIALDLLSEWSVMSEFGRTSAPFQWSKEGGLERLNVGTGDEEKAAHIGVGGADQLFEQHLGIQFIHCIPAATKGQRRAFLLLLSNADDTKPLSPELFLSFQQLFDQIETLTSHRSRGNGHDLNDREVECLKWAAAGKTSGEIAMIVALSEHTINHYLNSCCRKMDCVNRTQAVAKAIRLRLIQ